MATGIYDKAELIQFDNGNGGPSVALLSSFPVIGIVNLFYICHPLTWSVRQNLYY